VNDNINDFSTSGAVVNISNINSGCNGMANNYIYYCNHNLQVSPANTVVCTIKCGINFAQGIAIFIDWNQDNVFQNPSEKVSATSGVPPANTSFTVSFVVPFSQANGVYRMRVRSVYSTPGTVIHPCNNYSYGECEDYNVYVGITAPAPSTVITNATNNSPVCPGQNVNLQATTSGSTTGYNWTGPMSYTSNIQNPTLTSVTSSMAGTYYVAVTSGTCPLLAGTYVWVKQAPSLTVTSGANPSCSGVAVTLSVAAGGTASSYTWSTGSNSVTTQVSPTVNTTYTISASNNTCVTTMAYTQSVTICSGLDNLPVSEANLSLYPNPFKNQIRISTKVKVQIAVHDVLGKLIMEKVVSDGDVINTEELTPGTYFLIIKEGDYRKSIRIIKN
jgi:hypothetical protein